MRKDYHPTSSITHNETRSNMVPMINGKFILCFDTDFDINLVTEALGLVPTFSKRMAETRINAITKNNNCGFWEIETCPIETYDSYKVQQRLYQMTHAYIGELKRIIKEYKGESIYRFIVEVSDEFPALMFEEWLLADANYLKSKIDVVITNTL